MMPKPELLAPAGDLERLKIAFAYGADAVYLGGHVLSMRANAKNFSPEEMAEGIAYAHALGKKVYVAVNIFAHNADFTGIADYFISLEKMGADALIISDVGVFTLAKAIVPDMELHISTQANCTNFAAAAFWKGAGAARVILARELSLREIRDINRKVPGLHLEAFVHGAMCMAYSGRCLISNYMGDVRADTKSTRTDTGSVRTDTGSTEADNKSVKTETAMRDANGGDCIQPCRWNYTPINKMHRCETEPDKTPHLHEAKSDETLRLREAKSGEALHPRETKSDETLYLRETKSGKTLHLQEDTNGTYIFNARDLCMIRYIPELVYAGIRSFKIEGRMKTAYYVAATVKTYREAIDDHYADPELYESKLNYYTAALNRLTVPYSTGFYFGKPTATDHSYNGDNRFSNQDFLAIVESYDLHTQLALVEQRNKFSVGDKIEVLHPITKNTENINVINNKDIINNGINTPTTQILNEMYDENGTAITSAPHPKQKIRIKIDTPVEQYAIIRK